MRRERPSGVCDSENGCASHQRPRVRKRQRKNSPGRAAEPFELPAGYSHRNDVPRLRHHLDDAQPEAEGVDDRRAQPEQDEGRQRDEVEGAPVVRCHFSKASSFPVGIWWNQASAIPA